MNSKPLLIGLAGKARSGKDTAAKMIENTFIRANLWVSRYSFAYPIKAAASVAFGFTRSQLYGDRKDLEDLRFGVTPRHVLQQLGTEFGRDLVHSDVWVMRASDNWEDARAEGFNMVISDVRFENEADFVRDAGGTVVHMVRDDVEPVGDHQSEAGIRRQFDDLVLDNTGTLAELEDNVKQLMDSLGVRE